MNKLRLLDLFSGIGGFSLSLERSGYFETVAFCEIEPFPRRVLAKHWPNVPIYEDVRTLTATKLADDRIGVDAICGGFPCQDISYAGPGAGLDGERSGLWREFFRLISEFRPALVLVENVAALLDRGLSIVCGDLASIGYDADWSVVSACAVGTPHVRRRLFALAYPDSKHGRPRLWNTAPRKHGPLQALDGEARPRSRFRARLANPSSLYGGADGLPYGMERNRGLGNAIAPDVAELIGRAIGQAMTEAA